MLANASSLAPYPLHDMDGPVYNWPRTGPAPLVDDYGRPFPGNTYNNSDALFTQCWNATDQPANQVTQTSFLLNQCSKWPHERHMLPVSTPLHYIWFQILEPVATW